MTSAELAVILPEILLCCYAMLALLVAAWVFHRRR